MDEFVPNLFKDKEQIENEIVQLMVDKTKIFNDNFDNCKFLYRNKEHSVKEMFNIDSLMVFKIANRKKRVIERGFEKQQELDEPSVIVILDNNNGVQRIAIQEDFSAFSDANIVATILQNSFNIMLKKFKLEINIQKEYSENEFWDYVKEHKHNINSVRFEFDYPNLPGGVRSSIKDLLKEVSQDTLSEKCAVEFGSKTGLDINENNEELQNLNRGAAELGNPISFKIKGYRKTIKTGKSTRIVQFDEADIIAENAEQIRAILN